MNILIIGSGGREHALAWKVAQSNIAKNVYVAPGNAGTNMDFKLKNVNISMTDIPALVTFSKKKKIELTIVGPEVPLMHGIVDSFRAAGLRIFGPTRSAAQLEGSKSFSKKFFTRHGIPTARYKIFTNAIQARDYISKKEMPIVIKADGLAAGKGVIVATTRKEAESAIKKMLCSKKNTYSQSQSIVIEEFLDGEEASFIVMVDGTNVLPMTTSQDYKRVGDGDRGPNTGGMGSCSPALVVTDDVHDNVMKKIIFPTVNGMIAEGNIYTGFLYAGLMICHDNQPKIMEFNCRLGDPEAQSILLRMKSDLIIHCLSAIEGHLNKEKFEWDEKPALSVVLATRNYPDHYRIGDKIIGLPLIKLDGEKVFHAGTRLDQGEVFTDGGRVLCVTAVGKNFLEAQSRVYSLVENISWSKMFYRRDIGYRTLARER